MAYANPLDPTKPAGGDKRKLGDDTIRTHILAIRERLSSIFVDVDADPLVLKDASVNGNQLVDGTIFSAKLQDDAVIAQKIAAGAVTTPKILDGNVTPSKIAGAGDYVFPGLVDAATGFRVAGAAPAGQFLKGDGAKAVFSLIQAGDFPDALLQLLLVRFDGWFVDDVPAGSASFLTRYRTAGVLDQHSLVATHAGEIRKVWVRGDADTTAGTFTVRVVKNGVATAATAVISAVDPRQSTGTFGAGVVTFVAGDILSMDWVSAGLTPSGSTDFVAGFEARYTG